MDLDEKQKNEKNFRYLTRLLWTKPCTYVASINFRYRGPGKTACQVSTLVGG